MSSATDKKTQISNHFHNKPIDELIESFNTDSESGLKINQVKTRKQKYGANELPKVKKSLWKVYLAPIFNFLIVILIITAVVVIILGSPGETIITFTVIIINSVTAIVQNYRAQKALESLKEISALKARVLRGGEEKEINTREIIPGDIALIKQGDKIPADGRLIDEMNLKVNEAPLTGESEPVDKGIKTMEDQDIPVPDRINMVYMGTYVNEGRAKILITGTGANTEIGTISESLNKMGTIEDIPLTRKLNRLGYILGTIVIINLIILITYKFSLLQAQGNFVQEAISTALVDSILRAMNIIPINLPLLSTLVLVTGILNMAQSGVIIKNLAAIESLGRVSVICSDKTGTITKNEMTVERFWLKGKEFNVTGSGYNAEGKIYDNSREIELKKDRTFKRFIHSMVINNNAKLIFEDVKIHKKGVKEKAIRKALGSTTEAALLVLAEKAGYVPDDIKKKYKILKEFSFSSEIKRMSSITQSDSRNLMVYTKGAPERIISISSKIEKHNQIRSFDQESKEKVKDFVEKKAKEGYRTLAIAYKPLDEFNNPKREEIENDLTFLGFVSIMDPARQGVKEAVELCKSGKIKVIMITGDHPATAKTIAAQMNIYQDDDLVVEGKRIKQLNQSEFEKTSVFARVAPADKEIIVEHYQDQGKVCAMTGDGINDSPALKAANCGISMGITGTDLAKETSDMVISDDNFASIEKGVEIGRGLFSKIRTIIYFFICLNIMEGIIFFGYEFLPFFELFKSNWQHIYIFGIVHSLPSLALVIDKQPKDVMQYPPRNEEELLNKNMWVMLLLQAFFMGIGLILALELTLGGVIPLNGWNLDPAISYIPAGSTEQELIAQKARTMFITTIYITETTFIWTFRRPNKSIWQSIKEEFSLALFIVCIFTLLLHILHICFSYSVNYTVNEVLGLNFQINFMFLSASDWFICALFTLPGIIGIEVFKYIAHKHDIIF
ncbi:MAG: cation-translocating P-type ATPase [Promethearchaeia archaeon]